MLQLFKEINIGTGQTRLFTLKRNQDFLQVTLRTACTGQTQIISCVCRPVVSHTEGKKGMETDTELIAVAQTDRTTYADYDGA